MIPPLQFSTFQIVALVLGLGLLSGCNEYPWDPRDTSERASGHVVRVGLSENPPWAVADDRLHGVEVELVQGFADTLGAQVDWQRGSESVLLEKLERFELDVVVGGLTAKTPWKGRVATTIPYLNADTDGDGTKEKHVMAVPPGENGWLTRLDRFLHSHQREALVLFSSSVQAAADSATGPVRTSD